MATLRQRFLGWARPRTPEALPAAIIRQRVYVLPTPFGGFIGALLATMLLGALNYNNNPALMLGFLLAAAVHNSFVRAHLNLSGLQLLAVQAEPDAAGHEIGRASCRERECPYVEMLEVDVALKQKKTKCNKNIH